MFDFPHLDNHHFRLLYIVLLVEKLQPELSPPLLEAGQTLLPQHLLVHRALQPAHLSDPSQDLLQLVNISLATWSSELDTVSDTVSDVAPQKGHKPFLQSGGSAFARATQYAIVFRWLHG